MQPAATVTAKLDPVTPAGKYESIDALHSQNTFCICSPLPAIDFHSDKGPYSMIGAKKNSRLDLNKSVKLSKSAVTLVRPASSNHALACSSGGKRDRYASSRSIASWRSCFTRTSRKM